MKSFLRQLRWIGCAVILTWSTSVCMAAEPWPSVPFKYYARQSSLVRVLSDFSSTFGLAIAMSPDVDGKVTGDFAARTPTEFMNSLASSYGFNWYYQAGVLHISPAREWATDVLHVGMTASDVSALKTQLTNLGIFEPRFGWAEFPGRGIVIVSGPDSYVSQISSVVSKLGTGPSDGRQLRVFKLQNARAEDYTFSYQGQQVVTPGVATLLRNLAAGSMAQQSQNPSTGPLSVAPSAVAPLQAIPPMGEGGFGNPGTAAPMSQAVPKATAVSRIPDSPPSLPSAGAPSGGKVAVAAGLNSLSPVIEPDPRLNSVIVYDAPEKMPIYEALIRELDAGRPQIQIEAMIVDVATDKMDTLGVNWRAGGGSVSGGFSGGGNGQGTILSINTDGFFARIKALTTEGNARVLGRPSILTMDNLSAVLSLSQTQYVRVNGLGGGGKGGGGGSYGSLIPITTGTLLKVVPRLVDENNRRDVSMAVEIQDGQIDRDSEDTTDTLPTVKESAINTQAVVGENDCLLIGGYFMESDAQTVRRVPGLSRVPVLGALFRDKTGEYKRSARLFVIRPTVVPASSGAAQSASVDAIAANLQMSGR